MEGSAYLGSKNKLGLLHHHDGANHAAAAIPTSTPTCVVVKTFKTAVSKPRGTVKLKTQLDNAFPLFLRGKCTEQEFQVRLFCLSSAICEHEYR